jgi:hypothetical protein
MSMCRIPSCVMLFGFLCSASVLVSRVNDRVATLVNPRPITDNSLHDVLMTSQFLVQPTTSIVRFFIHQEVTESFRPERINQSMFGDDACACKKTITISGSQSKIRVANRDFLADYFYLPADFHSDVHFFPRVISVITRPYFYAQSACGAYGFVSFPFVYTNWNLNTQEFVKRESGQTGYDEGYVADNAVPVSNLLPSFLAYANGHSASIIDGVKVHALQRAKMACSKLTKKGLAAIIGHAGYTFYRDYWHAGVYLQGAVPTDNRPTGTFLFEPLINNGHQAMFGGGVHGHITFFDRPETLESACVYVNLAINGAFATEHIRTLDLVGRPLSRYQLAYRINNTSAPSLAQEIGNNIVPVQEQYAYELSPVANITTVPVGVNNLVSVDMNAFLRYTVCTTSFFFGCGLWQRSDETIRVKRFDSGVPWVVKGDAHVVGFIAQATPDGPPLGAPVALLTRESAATIYNGTNFPANGVGQENSEAIIAEAARNKNVDDAVPSFAVSGQYLVTNRQDTAVTNQVYISPTVAPIAVTDLDCASAATKGFAQKMYGGVSKTWNRALCTVTLHCGGEVDFARHAGPTQAKERCQAINTALSLWGVFIRGSVHW